MLVERLLPTPDTVFPSTVTVLVVPCSVVPTPLAFDEFPTPLVTPVPKVSTALPTPLTVVEMVDVTGLLPAVLVN